MNPYRDIVKNTSPTEFEILCLEVLKSSAEAEKLSNFFI